jgi:hypothetical protein
MIWERVSTNLSVRAKACADAIDSSRSSMARKPGGFATARSRRRKSRNCRNDEEKLANRYVERKGRVGQRVIPRAMGALRWKWRAMV